MGRKHSLEEVLSALKDKGCVITGIQPITKRVEKQIPVTEKKVVTDNDGKKVIVESVKQKSITVTEIIQEPYCVNITPGEQLGNRSLGKLDYLVKVHNYRIVRL